MIVDSYLSFLFEQEPPGVSTARKINPQLYSILKGIKVDLPTFNSFKTIVMMFQTNVKRCDRLEDLQEKLCISETKITLYRRELQILYRADRLCAIQRDPEACHQKVRNKSDQITEQIKKEQQRIVNIRSEMIKRRNEENEQRRKRVENVGKNIPQEVPVNR